MRAGKGDTVASIARRYKLAAASVADWNDVRLNAAFKAGQQVVVYLPVRPAQARSGKSTGKRATAHARKGGTPSKTKRR